MSSTDEKSLYPIVAKWLESQSRCFKTYINKGIKYGKIDVLGLKDIGGDLSGEIEAVSIEVKRGTEPFGTASVQALGYKVYAHRVYLADQRENPFSLDEIAIAGHLGIGLIQIKGKRCKEILTSPYYVPMANLHLQLLEGLGFGFCRLCGCCFEIASSQKETSSFVARNIKDAIKNGKGLTFWNKTVGERKLPFRNRKNYEGYTYERRFICPECIDHLEEWVGTLSSDA